VQLHGEGKKAEGSVENGLTTDFLLKNETSAPTSPTPWRTTLKNARTASPMYAFIVYE